MSNFHCRMCHAALDSIACDLGPTPLANSLCPTEEKALASPQWPLCVYVCTQCWLIQIPEHSSAEGIFQDYVYFSSYSESWLRHANSFAEMAIQRWGLSSDSRVIEAASNDGYLLQYFAKKKVQVLGIEPAVNVAKVAREKGIATESCFLGAESARSLVDVYGQADLLVANNVLAHVPDIHDFVEGLRILLGANGVLSIEFPHLLNLIEGNQFDTIYHEHFSYLSLSVVGRVLEEHGLGIFDVEQIPTHGGSLRVLARLATKHNSKAYEELCAQELDAGLQSLETYKAFARRVTGICKALTAFVSDVRQRGETLAAYGAAAKGNTLLNTCGIKRGSIDFVADASPHKQGLYLPGSGIEVCSPEVLRQRKPAHILILPWNLRSEIATQLSFTTAWGAKLYVPIPFLERVA